MPAVNGLSIRQLIRPDEVTPTLRTQMIDCWVAVTNSGGAAGFPFPPIQFQHAAEAADAILNALDPQRDRILVAHLDNTLAGWVHLRHDPNPLIAHWASVHHLQTHPGHRGRGIGTALMRRLHEIARDELQLEQLHLAARGGAGLEHFYQALGWREIGRWPVKLQLSSGDRRDEILMMINLL